MFSWLWLLAVVLLWILALLWAGVGLAPVDPDLDGVLLERSLSALISLMSYHWLYESDRWRISLILSLSWASWDLGQLRSRIKQAGILGYSLRKRSEQD